MASYTVCSGPPTVGIADSRALIPTTMTGRGSFMLETYRQGHPAACPDRDGRSAGGTSDLIGVLIEGQQFEWTDPSRLITSMRGLAQASHLRVWSHRDRRVVGKVAIHGGAGDAEHLGDVGGDDALLLELPCFRGCGVVDLARASALAPVGCGSG
jgi:hypothetical protein